MNKKILILVDRKDKASQVSVVEGSYAFQIRKWCEHAGIDLDQVEVIRLGNNSFDEDILNSNEVDEFIKNYNPDFIIGLGKMSLCYLKGQTGLALDNERGAPFYNVKNHCPTICTYTPRYIFMLYDLNVIVEHDFAKARRLAEIGWTKPEYTINFTPTFNDVIERLNFFLTEKDSIPALSVDIETLMTGKMTCIGFSWSETEAMTIPFVPYKFGIESRKWTANEEHIILCKIKEVLETCRCVGQNAVHFDHYVLFRRYGILTKFIDDTMFGFWELYPSFDKNLGFMSSMLTDNVYWKGLLKESRKGLVARTEEFRYNALDCIVALQCHNRIQERLCQNEAMLEHYKFNIRVSRAYQYMSARGCKINKEKLSVMKGKCMAEVEATQAELNDLAGKVINVKSPKQMKEWLYVDLGLPQKLKAKKDKFGNREAVETADALSVYKLAGEHPELPALTVAARLRKLHKKLSGLEAVRTESDGTCHWSFNCCGTKVGRSAGYKPLFEEGVQPQNVDKAFRDLFIPPDGMMWIKADLEGADSVTMAACMKALGQDQLMIDTLHRIKPAQTVALQLLTGKPFTEMSVEEILANKYLLKEPKGKKFYKITKAVNHGSAYMLGFEGMSDNMLRISEGELYVSPKECKHIQEMLFHRYDYRVYHKAINSIMCRDAFLVAANGQQRRFYGRADNATCREMCSYLPQVHTAYVTNKCIERFYYDKDAYVNGRPILQLCNQVHDELDGFIYEDEQDKFIELFKRFCYVPLTIWGIPFNIEFEVQGGDSWGNLNKDFNIYE